RGRRSRAMSLSLRARLATFYSVVLVLALAALGADIWLVEGRLGVRRVDRELEELVSTVSTIIRAELDEGAPMPAAADEACQTLAAAGRAVAIFDANGKQIAASLGGMELDARYIAPQTLTIDTNTTPSAAWRLRAEPKRYADAPVTLIVASSLRDVERQQHEVVETMWIALPLALLLSGAGGLWIAAAALRPITEMANQASRITAS